MKTVIVSAPKLGPVCDRLFGLYSHDPVSVLVDGVVTRMMLSSGIDVACNTMDQNWAEENFGAGWRDIVKEVSDLFNPVTLSEQFERDVVDAAMKGSEMHVYVEAIDDNSALITFFWD